ncbi:hypothetical protein NL676_017158 [Syzygium grande]|nr:hypothetical protein NL676_017158 [Syzygium grande]
MEKRNGGLHRSHQQIRCRQGGAKGNRAIAMEGRPLVELLPWWEVLSGSPDHTRPDEMWTQDPSSHNVIKDARKFSYFLLLFPGSSGSFRLLSGLEETKETRGIHFKFPLTQPVCKENLNPVHERKK